MRTSRYNYMRENLKAIENINEVLNIKIDDYLDYFKDDECKDRETLINVVMEFMLEVRTQNNLLNLAITTANKTNKMFVEDVNQEELLKTRY